MDQDPLISFLSSLSTKIKEEKDHKELMEKINSGETQNLEENSLEKALLKIKEKILEHKPSQPSNDLQVIKEVVVEDNKTQVAELEVTDIQEEDNFGDFISKLRGVLTGKPLPVREETKQEAEEIKNVPVTSELPDKSQTTAPIAAPISNKSDTTNTSEKYLDALDSITNDVAKETEPAKVSEIKKLIEEYAGKYIKKAIVMSEYAGGGGTNAVQYAEGGTMNGDLNVNGHILSGGKDISSFFGGGSGTQTLTFNNSNADLSISNGNTVNLSILSSFSNAGDAAVNTLVHANSGQWNDAYTNLISNSAAYLLSGFNVDLGDIPALSSNWNSVYTTVQTNSANWNNVPQTVAIMVAVSDEYSNLTTGNSKISFIAPYNFTITKVKANINTSSEGADIVFNLVSNASGTVATVTVAEGESVGTTTGLSYAASEDEYMHIDVTQVGSTIPGSGLKTYIIGTIP